MSFFTALSLSLNNLMTKKARTILTSFAGSIGIIGIALILSVSTGVQTYIDRVQEDTLSSYPITINAEEVDMTSLLTSMMETAAGSSEREHELDAVYENQVMYEMMNSVNSMQTLQNNLVKFKEFLEANEEIREYASAISYSYDTDMNVYVTDAQGNIIKSDIVALMSGIYKQMGVTAPDSMMSSFGQISAWQELLPEIDGSPINSLMNEQYEVVTGRWPESYNEVVVVVSENHEISDMMLYALGLKTAEEIQESMKTASEHEQIDISTLKSWTYDDILNIDFRVILNCDKYQHSGSAYIDATETEAGLKYLYDSENAIKLKVVGIIRPNDDAVSSYMTGAIGYTSDLTEYIIERTNESKLVTEQKNNPEIEVITGLKFKVEGEEITFDEIKASVDEWLANRNHNEKATLYTELASIPDEAYLAQAVMQYRQTLTPEAAEKLLLDAVVSQTQMDEETIAGYIAGMDEATKEEYLLQIISAVVMQQYAAEVSVQLGTLAQDQIAAMLDAMVLTDAQYSYIHDNHLPATRSDSTYEKNLRLLGSTDLGSPRAINIFASTFENKDAISALIEEYNEGVEEDDKIEYTDIVALLMSSISSVINVISYVLIAFVAISLVVS
ncbi:MAG: ABC transporter, partial [Oscillospiraceae bacterium]|nr:ABC transporter [Oscillospiraceae bacterium]